MYSLKKTAQATLYATLTEEVHTNSYCVTTTACPSVANLYCSLLQVIVVIVAAPKNCFQAQLTVCEVGRGTARFDRPFANAPTGTFPPPYIPNSPHIKARAVSLQGPQTVCRSFKDDGERSLRNFAIGKNGKNATRCAERLSIAPCTIPRSFRILGTSPLAPLITPEFLERCLPTSGLATLVAQQAYS